jgi:5-methylcytosine-specific restriction endonuclease McrA
LERDGYRCQHCSTDQILEVHHIDGRGTTTPKELRNHALENLLTLCTSCHAKEHARMRHSS